MLSRTARLSALAMMLFVFLFAQLSSGQAEDGMIIKKSAHSVTATLDRLADIVAKKGLTIFARIDHAEGARKAGLELRPTQLLIFGNPKMGTPLMQSDQRIAVDLPIKVIAWQDANGAVWLGYWAPSALRDRYGISDQDGIFARITDALAKMTDLVVAAE